MPAHGGTGQGDAGMNDYADMMPAEFAALLAKFPERQEPFTKAWDEYAAALRACQPEAPDVDLMRKVGAL